MVDDPSLLSVLSIAVTICTLPTIFYQTLNNHKCIFTLIWKNMNADAIKLLLVITNLYLSRHTYEPRWIGVFVDLYRHIFIEANDANSLNNSKDEPTWTRGRTLQMWMLGRGSHLEQETNCTWSCYYAFKVFFFWSLSDISVDVFYAHFWFCVKLNALIVFKLQL